MKHIKALLFLTLLFVGFLLISAVSETSSQAEKKVEDGKETNLQTDAHCKHGCCKWGPHRRCIKCCPSEEKEVKDAEQSDAHCSHGCCKWFHHKCVKCCHFPVNAADVAGGKNNNGN